MKLIVTNDDGIEAPGLKALETALQGTGEAIVAAPAHAQSGVGHRVTTDKPIEVENNRNGWFRIAGTPADCARIALTEIAPDASWLVSGINRGGNLGADIYTSGTVAAAREAALLGYRAIAVSHYVAKGREIDWELAIRRVRPLLLELLSAGLSDGAFWNVNLPHPKEADPEPQVVRCALDTRPLSVSYRREGNALIYQGEYHKRPRQRGRDVDVCLKGDIAVTKITL